MARLLFWSRMMMTDMWTATGMKSVVGTNLTAGMTPVADMKVEVAGGMMPRHVVAQRAWILWLPPVAHMTPLAALIDQDWQDRNSDSQSMKRGATIQKKWLISKKMVGSGLHKMCELRF